MSPPGGRESRSVTIRLNTGVSAECSMGSLKKYPTRSNWNRSGASAAATAGSTIASATSRDPGLSSASMFSGAGAGTENSRSYTRTVAARPDCRLTQWITPFGFSPLVSLPLFDSGK